MGLSDSPDLTDAFNKPTWLSQWLDRQLAAAPSEESDLQGLADGLKANERLPKEKMVQDLARLNAQHTGKIAREWIDKTIDIMFVGPKWAEAADPKTDLFTPEQIHEYREDEIMQVRGRVDDDKKVAAYADLKERYEGLKAQYKGDKEKQKPVNRLIAMINRAKYDELPLAIFLGEIITPTTDLFTAAERKKWGGPFASEIKTVIEKPEDKRLHDLLRLQKKYDGNDAAQDLIHRAAGDLPLNIKAAVFKTHPALFSETQLGYLSTLGQRAGYSF
jgi:hypothetical protein